MKFNANYILLNLAASIKIMLGDRRGLNEIDQSAGGFWRSFLALLLAMPFTLSNKYSEYGSTTNFASMDQLSSLYAMLFFQETASLLAYFFSLTALFTICKLIGREAEFPISVVSLNWGSLGIAILSFPILVLMGIMDNTNALLTVLVLMLMVVFSLAMFNILRLTLQIPIRSAIMYVLILSVLEIITYFVILNVFGF